MPEYEVYGVAILPVIIALVSFSKVLGLPTKYSPILSIVLGMLAAAVYISPGDWRKFIFEGILIGLSASGLYSGTKNMANGNWYGNGNDKENGNGSMYGKGKGNDKKE